MAFKRQPPPLEAPSEDELTAQLQGLGFRLTGRVSREANIEDALFFASVDGMEKTQLRTLALLTTWLGVHSPAVNVDRLTRLVRARGTPRVVAYWSGIGRWLEKDRRFRRLAALHRGPRIDLLEVGTDFHVGRKGEDARFAGGPLRAPAGVLRDRAGDIETPEGLAKLHRAYRWRVLVGPSYRADMFAQLEKSPELTLAEVARRTYGSIATAFRVKHDRAILQPGRGLLAGR